MTYDETMKTLSRLHSLFAEGGDDSVFSSAEKGWISKLYKAETGKGIKECSCKNRYTDAVTELMLILRKRGNTAEEASYTLKEGVLIWIANECYSRTNITDAVAEEWLKMHPDGKNLFEKIA